ncbi:MAG: DNA polymerase III subunit delta' [Sphingomonadales bacterium]
MESTHPRQTKILSGHLNAQKTLLQAFSGERFHHAWMISGVKGIGKATLAYQFANHILSSGEVGNNISLFEGGSDAPNKIKIDWENPISQRVGSSGHGNLLSVEPQWDETKGAYKSDILVDGIRSVNKFFGKTASEGGWRIAIIDSADQLNKNAANALLKILEEPPDKALLLLVSHTPGKLLPTIRSRCQQLSMTPMSKIEVKEILGQKFTDLDDVSLDLASSLAEGAPGKAITIIQQNGLQIYNQILSILSKLPQIGPEAMHLFANSLSGKGKENAYNLFTFLLLEWIGKGIRLKVKNELDTIVNKEEKCIYELFFKNGSPVFWLDELEKIKSLFIGAAALNLDKKQVIINTLTSLELAIAKRV